MALRVQGIMFRPRLAWSPDPLIVGTLKLRSYALEGANHKRVWRARIFGNKDPTSAQQHDGRKRLYMKIDAGRGSQPEVNLQMIWRRANGSQVLRGNPRE